MTLHSLSDEKDLGVYEMLLALVRSLVDRPEDVVITPAVLDGALHFRVQTHPLDTGKLVGSGGRTARALRIILNANAARIGRTLALDIVSGQPRVG